MSVEDKSRVWFYFENELMHGPFTNLEARNILADDDSCRLFFFNLCRFGSPDEVRQAIKSGADCSWRDILNRTPLHYAKWNQRYAAEIITILNEASPDPPGDSGNGPAADLAKPAPTQTSPAKAEKTPIPPVPAQPRNKSAVVSRTPRLVMPQIVSCNSIAAACLLLITMAVLVNSSIYLYLHRETIRSAARALAALINLP